MARRAKKRIRRRRRRTVIRRRKRRGIPRPPISANPTHRYISMKWTSVSTIDAPAGAPLARAYYANAITDIWKGVGGDVNMFGVWGNFFNSYTVKASTIHIKVVGNQSSDLQTIVVRLDNSTVGSLAISDAIEKRGARSVLTATDTLRNLRLTFKPKPWFGPAYSQSTQNSGWLSQPPAPVYFIVEAGHSGIVSDPTAISIIISINYLVLAFDPKTL